MQGTINGQSTELQLKTKTAWRVVLLPQKKFYN